MMTTRFIFYFIYLHLPHRINMTERKGKKIYIYYYYDCKFTGQEKLRNKNSSKLNLILSDLTFVIDRVARKRNRS